MLSPCNLFVISIQSKFNNQKLLKAYYTMDNFLSIVLFSTKKHSYTVGDMITLTSGMIILCCVAFISLIIGIK